MGDMMNVGHKVYTVVWFEGSVRHEREFPSKYGALRFGKTLGSFEIEEDWLEPNVSY
jgi:hypothetical protein